MEPNKFKITKVNGTIILEKEGNKLSIWKALDDDIFFATSKEELYFEISMHSRTYSEWQTYIVFENLMKAVVGRYILSGDSAKEDSRLPEDFVNLSDKVITWYSDSGIDNVLKVSYDKDTITITVSKSKIASQNESNIVRIRTDGSNYEGYYQEFLEFFARLSKLEYSLNKNTQNSEAKLIQPPNQKKLLFFKKNKR